MNAPARPIRGGASGERFGNDLKTAIRAAFVQTELAEMTRSRLPLPACQATEERILSAVLAGLIAPALLDLSPTAFFYTLNRAIWRAACNCQHAEDLKELAAQLVDHLLGSKEEIARELVEIRATAIGSFEALNRDVARLQELEHARLLVEQLERIAVTLRTGTSTTDEASRTLRALVAE